MGNYGQDSIISTRQAPGENPIKIYNQLTQDQVYRSSSPDRTADHLQDHFKSTFNGITKKAILDKGPDEIKSMIAKNIQSNTSSHFQQSQKLTYLAQCLEFAKVDTDHYRSI